MKIKNLIPASSILLYSIPTFAQSDIPDSLRALALGAVIILIIILAIYASSRRR